MGSRRMRIGVDYDAKRVQARRAETGEELISGQAAATPDGGALIASGPVSTRTGFRRVQARHYLRGRYTFRCAA